MSSHEISQLIPQIGVKPTLLGDDMMKQLTWSDQWIGYDDDETIEMKKKWAGEHCFGGTMAWSIDMRQAKEAARRLMDVAQLVLEVPAPEVVWSSDGSLHRSQTSTLTIPAFTTTEIPVWEYTITSFDTESASSTSDAFFDTSRILPPPFVFTAILPPEAEETARARTITPLPFPYTFDTPGNKEEPTLFPKVTFKVGPPGLICKSGCGKRCLIFCKAPCLLNCADDDRDFIDPEDPEDTDPPGLPIIDDPEPTGTRNEIPPLDDPDQDDPEDEEQEEDDQQCAFALDLPTPTFEGVDTSNGNSTSSGGW